MAIELSSHFTRVKNAQPSSTKQAAAMAEVAADDALDMPDVVASPSPAPSSTGDSIFSTSDEEALVDRVVPPEQRVSIYVQVFQEMMETVLEHESFLFNEEEIDLMRRFSEMSCR